MKPLSGKENVCIGWSFDLKYRYKDNRNDRTTWKRLAKKARRRALSKRLRQNND
jgi:hypothetical protein